MDDLDYEVRGIDDLLGQWKELPRWRALVAGLAAGAEQMSDEWTEIGPGCAFDVATDDALDQWGKLIGQEREGCTDDEYRFCIAARAVAIRSYGTRDEIIELVAAAVGGSITEVGPLGPITSWLTLAAFPPMSYVVTVSTLNPLSDQHRAAFARIFEDARANCINGVCVLAAPIGTAFQYDGNPGTTGFDDGEYAGVL